MKLRAGGPARARRSAWWAGAIALSVGAAWLSVRQMRWSALAQTLKGANLLWLGASLGLVLATTAVKAMRWQVLLAQCGPGTSFGKVVRALFIGQLGNGLLPARLGDAARVVLVAPSTAGGASAAVGTIVAEKTLDGVMSLFVLSCLAVATSLPGWIRRPLVGLAAVTCVLLVLVLLGSRQPCCGTVLRRLRARLPERVRQPLSGMASGFARGAGFLATPLQALAALGLSVAVWTLAALTNVTTQAALGISTQPWSAWLVLVAVYAATFLPTIPAQLGVFEYACLLALAAAGVAHEPSLAFGLALHVVVYMPPAILGPVSLAFEGLTWSGLKARVETPTTPAEQLGADQ